MESYEYTTPNLFRDVFINTRRPYRLHRMCELVAENILTVASEEMACLALDAWIDSESPGVNDETWRLLLGVTKSYERESLSADELAERDALPEKFTIYRGTHDNSKNNPALSWTLSKETAEWFANRWNGINGKGGPVVLERMVSKDDVLGPLNARGEHEMILLGGDDESLH